MKISIISIAYIIAIGSVGSVYGRSEWSGFRKRQSDGRAPQQIQVVAMETTASERRSIEWKKKQLDLQERFEDLWDVHRVAHEMFLSFSMSMSMPVPTPTAPTPTESPIKTPEPTPGTTQPPVVISPTQFPFLQTVGPATAPPVFTIPPGAYPTTGPSAVPSWSIFGPPSPVAPTVPTEGSNDSEASGDGGEVPGEIPVATAAPSGAEVPGEIPVATAAPSGAEASGEIPVATAAPTGAEVPGEIPVATVAPTGAETLPNSVATGAPIEDAIVAPTAMPSGATNSSGFSNISDCPSTSALTLGAATDANTSAVPLDMSYNAESTNASAEAFASDLESELIRTAVFAIFGCYPEIGDKIAPNTQEIANATCTPTVDPANECFVMQTTFVVWVDGDSVDPDVAAYDAYTQIKANMDDGTYAALIDPVVKIAFVSPVPLLAPGGGGGSTPQQVDTTDLQRDVTVSPWTIGFSVASVMGGFVSLLVYARSRKRRRAMQEDTTPWVNPEAGDAASVL